jgi:uncharacterized protein
MHFAREDCPGEGLIRAYERGLITVGEQQYVHSLILGPGLAIAPWRPQHADDLLHEDFDPVVALRPEILLLGTGSRLNFPAPKLTVRLLQSGIGVEVMDTAAACRTYNILLAEQRRVVAALLLD